MEPDPRVDDDAVHDALAACIDAWHDGGPAAADAVVARHPQFGAVLRERLEKLQRAGMLGDVAPADEPAVPLQVGEFRLGKRIGSGGMGVVHVAEQLSLGRTVAVKMLRPEQRFFPGARARFRREVEAIARLGDAGIVPIHCVGEDQGIDFFAMEYVRGATLAEVVAALHGTTPAQRQGRDVAAVAVARAELPLPEPLPDLFHGSWVSTCCRIVARMARSVHHAHERGVVHRDLKPNNAMVTPDGRVLLLDFGLAAADGSARITRSGAMLGTPHYMAPEQLEDGQVDVRTDVYALGVTLHELLALAPPFEGRSEAGLRQRILVGDATPLRRANPEVPRDVATIVEVARERDAARRYASAQALADDLERFLQHRPIQARPAGPLRRLLRWSQRHPAASTAAVLVVTGLAALPVVVRWSRGDADARAETAEQLAQRNLRGALDAVSRMLAQARSSAMRQAPGLDEARARQVAEASELMARLQRENPDDSAVARLFVRGTIRVAELRRAFGDHDGALAALAGCELVLQDLAARFPDDPDVWTDRAGYELNCGSSLAEQGRTAEAAARWQAVLTEFGERAPRDLPDEVVLALASCHNNLSRVVFADGDVAAAIGHLETAQALEQLVSTDSDGVDQRLDRCRTRLNLAIARRARGGEDADVGPELASLEAALAELVQAWPGEPEVVRELARVHGTQAAAASARGEFAAARARRATAIAALEELVTSFAERAAYRQELGVLLHEDAGDAQLAGELDAAAALADRAVASHRELLQRAPDNAEFATQAATFLRQRSTVALLIGDEAGALAGLAEAIALQERVAAAREVEPRFAIDAAVLHQELAVCHLRAGRPEAARDALRAARDHYEAALGRGFAPAGEANRLPKLLFVLAQTECACGDPDAAMASLRRHQEVRPVPAGTLRRFGERLRLAGREDFAALLQATEAAEAAADSPR